jgi:hypothetical protein
MKWLTREGDWQFYCLMTGILLSIPIHIAIRYYFWNWSPENFNNIVTPLATVGSGILVYFALRQASKQNKITLAQSLRDVFNDRLKYLKTQMEENRRDNVLRIIGVVVNRPTDHYNNIDINSINFAEKIFESLNRIRDSDDYQQDYDDYLENSHNPNYKLPRLQEEIILS